VELVREEVLMREATDETTHDIREGTMTGEVSHETRHDGHLEGLDE